MSRKKHAFNIHYDERLCLCHNDMVFLLTIHDEPLMRPFAAVSTALQVITFVALTVLEEYQSFIIIHKEYLLLFNLSGQFLCGFT